MPDSERELINRRVTQLFAQVSEALAGATHALLNGDVALGQTIVEADRMIDVLTHEVGGLVWSEIESAATPRTGSGTS